MGANKSKNVRSDYGENNKKLSELSPENIAKLKQNYQNDPAQTFYDKKQLMSTLNIDKRVCDILFDYFDMDGDGRIDNYELTCALAMIVHSSLDLRSEFLFKLYDFDQNNYLSRDELNALVLNLTLARNKAGIQSEIENKVDEIINEADLDQDKRLSMKEFQSYAAKNRDVFKIMDQYCGLLSNNPMSGNKRNQQSVNDLEDNNDEDIVNQKKDDSEILDDEQNNMEFGEDQGEDGTELDPDLYEELQKEKDADNHTEEKELIKKGIEFGNGFAEADAEGGDQFGACKPWITNVVNCVPSDYKPSKSDGETPDANLELEWVHGIRVHDTRNNLRYTSNGEFVYHTAAVGIVYNKQEHSQRFYIEHMDDITALAIHPNRKYVATGEIGPYPLISVWDVEENKSLCTIREPLKKGINHLAFSKDGKYLAASAADDAHNVAVFDWQKGTAEDLSTIKNCRLRTKKGEAQCKGPVVGTCEGGRANILGMCFNNSGETLACCCVKEVNFITIAPGKMKKRKATGLRGKDLTSIMCCGYLGNTLLCGNALGKLLVCAGTQFTKSIKAHTSTMNSIFIRDNDIGFITGGADGLILVWDKKYSIQKRLSLKSEEIHSLNPKVRSIDENQEGNILVSTRGGEIVEFENEQPTVYEHGHWDKELWGLAPSKSKNFFYTVGEDKLLGIWDIATRKLQQYTVLPEAAKTIDVSPDGNELAIGCANGNFYIYDAISLKQKYKKKESVTKSVSEVKYSPSGAYLAVGGIDKAPDAFSHIFVYDVKNKYKCIKKMGGHTSRITHMDWSSDEDYVQSNSSSYELLYHSIGSGKQIKGISSMKDVEWATVTIVLGWPCQGIWPECASGDDINAVDIDKTRRVMVTADDYSKVKLFKYPSPVEHAMYNVYNGHSSHVTNCRFTSDNKHVITTGGNDKAIFQFKFAFNDEAMEEEHNLDDIDENEVNPDEVEEDEYFKEAEDFQGDEFGASKPWMGEMTASSPKINITKNSGKAPPEGIKRLSYVFGYRGFDTRMNVKYLKEENKILYHTAALCIVLDTKTNKQKYFTNHEEDIVSLDLHPNGVTVASGMMAAKGKAKAIDMFVWNSNNLEDQTNCLASERENLPEGCTNLKGVHLRAVSILKFSPDGKKLLSGGQDDSNSIAIHDTSNLRRIALVGTSKVDGSFVLDACWKSNDEFITVGPKHIKFWKVKGRNISSSKGVFGKIKNTPLTSVACAFKKVFTGTYKGQLITWEGSNASTSKDICKNGPVYCLYYYKKDNLLMSGGFDGVITAFDSGKLNEKWKIEIQKITKSICDCGIRSLDCNDENILCGTKGCEIYEISLKTHQMEKKLMEGHYQNELWAVAVNPKNSLEVASGGGDKTLRIWDIKKNKMKKIMMFPEDFRAIDWSSDGKFMVIGTMPGIIYYVDVAKWERSSPFKSIFYADENKKKKQKSDKDKWIQELKISPDNEHCAFGSHCGLGDSFGRVQVLTINRDLKNPFTQFNICNPKITSACTHLDWSNDNDRIVVNSLAFELKYISISTKSVVKSSACVWEEDMWNTWTCLFGFPVQGIWPPASTGYVVNYTCLSNNKKVIATGDDFSLVKLFKSPCVVEHADYKAYGGHSSHIPKVRFTPNDKYLISVGGNDKAVMVWETDFGQNDGNDNEEQEEQEEQAENEEENYPEEDNHNEEEEEVNNEEQEEEEEEEIKPKPKKKKPQQKTKSKGKRKRKEEDEDDGEEAHQYDNDDDYDAYYQKELEKSKKMESKIKRPNKKQQKQVEIENDEEEQEEEQINEEEEEEEERKPKKKSLKKKGKQREEEPPQEQIGFEEQEEYQGDNAGNMQDLENFQNELWRNTLGISPDKFDKSRTDKPNIRVSLAHVFGYRTKDNRQNVRYITENSIIYQSGNLLIIHNLDDNHQEFLCGHRVEILAIALNNSRTLCATTEVPTGSNSSNLFIWDIQKKEIKSRIKIDVDGINNVGFSPNSKIIACCGLDTDHSIFLIDVDSSNIIFKKTGTKNKIYSLAFKNDKEFAVSGLKQLKIWKINNDSLEGKDAQFPKDADTKIGVVITHENLYVTGSSTGNIYLWDNENFALGKKIHNLAIDCLFSTKDAIISGSRDMTIVIVDKDLKELRRLSIDTGSVTLVSPNPRSIDIYKENLSKILIGTIGSEIFEMKFSKNYLFDNFEPEIYLNGHFSTTSSENNQIKDMVYWKNREMLITVGEDSTLRLWDINSDKIDTNIIRFEDEKIQLKPSSVCLSGNEEIIFVGYDNGKIRLYISNDFTVKKEISFRKKPISAMKVSPDNKYLATATSEEDDSIIVDLYNCDTYQLVKTLKNINGIILTIDWSNDSRYILLSTNANDVVIYDVESNKKLVNPEINKNIEWDTWQSIYGWPLLGYYDARNARCSACERLGNENYIGVGDENGALKIFNYPILNPAQSSCNANIKNSKGINNLRFCNNNVLFTSSLDGILYKWKITSN